MGLMLPTRIDVLLKDGRYGVVLDCSPLRHLSVHFGTYTQAGQERRVIELIDCLQLKEVIGWGRTGSAVTRLSTATSRKPSTRPTT